MQIVAYTGLSDVFLVHCSNFRGIFTTVTILCKFVISCQGEKPSTETPKGDYPTVIHPKHDPAATVLVVQAYAYGKYLGNLNVSFDDDGAVSGFGGNTFLLDDSVVEGMHGQLVV